MRYILAVVSFIIAALLLGYAAFAVYVFHEMIGFSEIDFSMPEVRYGLGMMGGSFVLGLLFVAGGIAVLASKPRRKE